MGDLIGKYRATVDDNVDPMGHARLLLSVPSQHLTGVWALACLPPMPAALLVIPDIGTRVWVEFEGGDPGCAVWTGALWDDSMSTGLRVVPDPV